MQTIKGKTTVLVELTINFEAIVDAVGVKVLDSYVSNSMGGSSIRNLPISAQNEILNAIHYEARDLDTLQKQDATMGDLTGKGYVFS